APGIELRLDRVEILLRRATGDGHAGILEAHQHALRQHEGVRAQETQQVLATEAAKARAALAQHFEQADLSVARRAGEEFAEAAVLLGDIYYVLCVGDH